MKAGNANWKETGEQALARRQARFQVLVTQTHQRLYNYARRSVGNAHDAEDVTQEALTRAWTHFETFDPRYSFEAWLFRIAGNIIIDQSRKRKRRPEISLDAPTMGSGENENGNEGGCCPELPDSASGPQERLLEREISGELQAALRSLPHLHQATLLMIAQERSYEQIAHALNCPMGTIRSRVYRARVLLRRNLEAGNFQEQQAAYK